MERKPIVWNPDECDLLQGDIIIFKLPKDFQFSKSIQIDPRGNRLVIAEGEQSGHHHEILLGPKLPQPTSFRANEGEGGNVDVPPSMAKFVGNETKAEAFLYSDPAAYNKLVQMGELTTTTLALGILEVKGGPMMLQHPEHDPYQIPPGVYYAGGQREFDAEQERRVRD